VILNISVVSFSQRNCGIQYPFGVFVKNGIYRLPSLTVWLSAFFVVIAAIGAAQAAYTTERIALAQWEKMLAEVKSQPGSKCEGSEGNQYICDIASPPTIWVFTRPGHPAHPAASSGVMVFRKNTIDIDRSGYYAGDRTAYIVWMEAFGVLDARQILGWKNSLAH
jgi:hypothetical protein